MNFDWVADMDWKLLIAGICGGLSRWITTRENWKDGLLSMIAGGIAAVYVGPVFTPLFLPAADWLGVDRESVLSFGGYAAGLSAVAVSAFIIGVVHAAAKRWAGK